MPPGPDSSPGGRVRSPEAPHRDPDTCSEKEGTAKFSIRSSTRRTTATMPPWIRSRAFRMPEDDHEKIADSWEFIDPSNSTKLWERIWKWCHTFEKRHKDYYGINSRGRSGTEYDVFTAISCQRSQLQRTPRGSYGLTSSISNISKNSPERSSRRATAQDPWREGQTIGEHQTDIRMRTPRYRRTEYTISKRTPISASKHLPLPA